MAKSWLPSVATIIILGSLIIVTYIQKSEGICKDACVIELERLNAH